MVLNLNSIAEANIETLHEIEEITEEIAEMLIERTSTCTD